MMYDIVAIGVGLFQKKSSQTGGVDKDNEISGIFRFVNLPLEIPEKTSLHPWKFYKIVRYHLEIPRSKTKTPIEVPNDFFLDYPWKFHFFFD